MVMFLIGSFNLKILELRQPKIKYLFVISLLKSVVPVELRSCSMGKAWKLSHPNRMEILLEWESWLCLEHALHWFGITVENAEVMFNLSLIAYSCSLNLFKFRTTFVARTFDPSPMYGSRLI